MRKPCTAIPTYTSKVICSPTSMQKQEIKKIVGSFCDLMQWNTDEYALVLHTWIHIFAYSDTYAFWRSSASFRFLQHLYILELWNVLHTCPPSLTVLSCVHTSRINTSTNIRQSSTQALYVARTFAPSQTHIPSYPIIFQVHYITYPNIVLHESTRMPNIWYYPRTAHRIFAIPSETFGHQFIRLYSIPNALIRISEYFYCTRTCIQAFSSLHSSPSIRHLSSIL